MRLDQWLKNVLILVPLALIAPRATLADITTFLCGFLLFGLLTSGTYLFNDILDAEADRVHPSKLRRPIASGELPLPIAGAAALVLVGLALWGAAFLSLPFFLASLAYLTLTLAYSFRLKSIPIVDVLLIAVLFTLRILAGMLLIGGRPSEWLLMFSIFFFLSLVLIKRYVELGTLAPGDVMALRGRGYTRNDQTFVMAFGVASGVASLIIFALFVSSMMIDHSSHYVTPQLLWGALAVMTYWLMRMWLLTMRGLMQDDPLAHAAQERATFILAAAMMGFVIAAQFLPL
jgi:4-hydroxybenzoate polyprenyltransferase